MAKRHKLTSGLSQQYSIIGIATQLKDFKLCHFINQALGIKLIRDGEIPVNISGADTLFYSPFYRFYDPPNKINWYLIANKNHDQQRMLFNLKQLDFFLINDAMPPFMDIKDFISSINQISNVQLTKQIATNEFKGLNYLLQDLELYLLELDRKNKH